MALHEPMPLLWLGNEYLSYQRAVVGTSDASDRIATALRDVAELAPVPDHLGNLQSVWRLDIDGNGGLVCTFPATVDVSVVRAAASR